MKVNFNLALTKTLIHFPSYNTNDVVTVVKNDKNNNYQQSVKTILYFSKLLQMRKFNCS